MTIQEVREILQAVCALIFFALSLYVATKIALRRKPQKQRRKRITICFCGTQLIDGVCQNPACEFNGDL